MDKHFSIIIPAHNEAGTIQKVLRAACASKAREVIVVDDGSSDGTRERVKAIKDDRVRLISHRVNMGLTNAWKTGIYTATSSILIFFDADIESVNNTMFEKLARPILRGTADYVVGGFDNFGRITEFLIRPLLKHFLPSLAEVSQPLSGLFAARREFLFPGKMAERYATVGLLIDAYFAGARIADVELGEIVHDKRPNSDKVAQANSECEIFFKKMDEYGVIKKSTRQTLSNEDLFKYNIAYLDS